MKKGIIFLTGIMAMAACTQNERISHPDPDTIHLSWEFKGNHPQSRTSSAVFTIENHGKEALGSDDWMLYFNQGGRRVVEGSVSGHVRIEHINGDLQRIVPLDGFMLGAGQKVVISYDRRGNIIKECEAPDGPYLVFGNPPDSASVGFALKNYTVKPFPELGKIYPRGSGVPLPDAAWVYEQNAGISLLDPSSVGRIIPTPVQVTFSGEQIEIGRNVKIHYAAGLENEAGKLADMLETAFGMNTVRQESGDTGPGIIRLELKGTREAADDEAYRMMISREGGVQLTGESPAGVFYGIQSLLALFPVEAWKGNSEEWVLPCGEIRDEPAFAYRGIMLDLARNFSSMESIRHLVDIMAFYKMNRLHLGLSNDEGWRLEIPSLPELTEVGAFRGHTRTSKDHLFPAYGSGPDPDPATGAGSGFLSREEFIGLLKYTAERHITVIPEINFPGHARAAVYSMEARYDRLMAEGREEEAREFRLIDPEDRSVYNSAQNFNDNVICVCSEAPYRFFQRIVDELEAMYGDAGLELETLHVGGDEVPEGSWTASPRCAEFLKEHGELGGAGDLQRYFEGRLLEILTGRGMVMAGWEEIALKKDPEGRREWIPNTDFAGRGMLPFIWNCQDDARDLGNRVANAGFPVVLCDVEYFYLDLAYTQHPAEPGLHWGGYVNTRRGFEFIPYGQELGFEGMESLEPGARKKLLGLQGELWAEQIRNAGRLEYAALPKMLGLVERAWVGQADWGWIPGKQERMEAMGEAWNAFANVVGQRELPRLDYLGGGYGYRLPPPGAVIREGILYARVDFPGLAIRYTTDGSDPGPGSAIYTGAVKVEGPVRLATFDTRGRSSRVSVAE